MVEVWCFIICFSYPTAPVVPADSFCSGYKQVVLTPGEVKEVMKLETSLRKRLQGNELLYLCHCKGAKLAECSNG